MTNAPDKNEFTQRDSRIIETVAQRHPFFESYIKDRLALVQDNPQIVEGILSWVYCGSSSYLLSGLATETHVVNPSSGEISEAPDVFRRPAVRGLLLTPTVVPHDIDIVRVNSLLPSPMVEDNFVFNHTDRIVVHTVNGKQIHSIHPLDTFIGAIQFPLISGVPTKEIVQKGRKYERVASAFEYEWTMDTMADKYLVRAKSVNLSHERILQSLSPINQPLMYGVTTETPTMLKFFGALMAKIG